MIPGDSVPHLARTAKRGASYAVPIDQPPPCLEAPKIRDKCKDRGTYFCWCICKYGQVHPFFPPQRTCGFVGDPGLSPFVERLFPSRPPLLYAGARVVTKIIAPLLRPRSTATLCDYFKRHPIARPARTFFSLPTRWTPCSCREPLRALAAGPAYASTNRRFAPPRSILFPPVSRFRQAKRAAKSRPTAVKLGGHYRGGVRAVAKTRGGI